MRRKMISVIGDAHVEENSWKYKVSYEIGKQLVDNGYRVMTGGLGGVMEAVLRGARDSEKYKEGDTVAMITSYDPDQANHYADIVIPTGLDVHRNSIDITADAVVAIGGGAGTLSEMAFAWAYCKLIVGVRGVEGWSAKLADQRIDHRERYPYGDDCVFGADNAEDVLRILNEKIDLYRKVRRPQF